jgi:hypothetical protein
MELTFNLYWLRERARDHGRPVRADQLDSVIRDRVLAAAEGCDGVLDLKLPYMDRREVRRCSEVLRELRFERHGNEIRASLTPVAALRTAAAELALCHPAWTNAPVECEPGYFRTWRRVAESLQTSLRKWIPREHFSDAQLYGDRDAAYPWIVYEAARVYHGNPPQDFTYDLRDFPECLDTLETTWIRIASSIQKVLEGVEKRLYDAGLPALARRYAPRWHEDVLREVQRRPAPLFKLMAVETELIDAVIDLGTARSTAAVCRFGRIANLRFRNFQGRDMRPIAIDALHEATRALASSRRTASCGVETFCNVPLQPSFQNNSASDLRT